MTVPFVDAPARLKAEIVRVAGHCKERTIEDLVQQAGRFLAKGFSIEDLTVRFDRGTYIDLTDQTKKRISQSESQAVPTVAEAATEVATDETVPVKRGRGRPKKVQVPVEEPQPAQT